MLGSCIIPLIHNYDVKEVKLHLFKHKCDDNLGNKTFDVEKCDRTMFKILFNTALLFDTMLLRMDITGSMMYSYFDKCLLDNVIDTWQLVTPHKDNQTIENFKISLQE